MPSIESGRVPPILMSKVSPANVAEVRVSPMEARPTVHVGRASRCILGSPRRDPGGPGSPSGPLASLSTPPTRLTWSAWRLSLIHI